MMSWICSTIRLHASCFDDPLVSRQAAINNPKITGWHADRRLLVSATVVFIAATVMIWRHAVR